ncbi:MBL fold metallo-hydrolase [Thermococcus sp.]|uniref:MBL fold metallo-hydrolase n=1 Tax=Thermococcus sp. TaxID=35749 RepID=UPI002612ED01|nr:MBL fold metallo-hydrolase [Thermococcus sp.]
MGRVKVTVLYENHSGFRKGLLGGHGFSALVEGWGKRVLVDTGMDGRVLLNNMAELDVEPDSIDYVFITHGHYDHTGGLKAFLKARSRPVKVVAHPGIFARRLALKPRKREIGIPFEKEELEELGAHFVLRREPFEFTGGFMSSGEVERETWDRAVGYLVKEGLRPDPVKDDIALIIDLGESVAVITGCGHSGVINIANHARKLLGKPVRVLIGGLHLIGAKPETLEDVVKNLDVGLLFTGHCTGLESFAYLRCRMNHVEPLHVGKSIEL